MQAQRQAPYEGIVDGQIIENITCCRTGARARRLKRRRAVQSCSSEPLSQNDRANTACRAIARSKCLNVEHNGHQICIVTQTWVGKRGCNAHRRNQPIWPDELEIRRAFARSCHSRLRDHCCGNYYLKFFFHGSTPILVLKRAAMRNACWYAWLHSFRCPVPIKVSPTTECQISKPKNVQRMSPGRWTASV